MRCLNTDGVTQTMSSGVTKSRPRIADKAFAAFTTASDALWAGVPVLTRAGETFPSRVGASLLRAVSLPELIAATASEFEELAVVLAHDPQRLHTLRQRLQQNRLTCPLFDCATFTRHIEAAYSEIYERYQAGLPTEHIRVFADSTRSAVR